MVTLGNLDGVVPVTAVFPKSSYFPNDPEVMFNDFLVLEGSKLYEYFWTPQTAFNTSFCMTLACATCTKVLHGVYENIGGTR